jgi:hypothetical protein
MSSFLLMVDLISPLRICNLLLLLSCRHKLSYAVDFTAEYRQSSIQMNKTGVPQNFLPSKEMKRGELDHRISSMEIHIFQCKDNKAVFFASSFHGS